MLLMKMQRNGEAFGFHMKVSTFREDIPDAKIKPLPGLKSARGAAVLTLAGHGLDRLDQICRVHPSIVILGMHGFESNRFI